jgi:lysophospholipase L1-like esterase
MSPPRFERTGFVFIVLTATLVIAGCGGGGKSTGSSAGSASAPSNFDFGGNDPRRASAFGDSITFGVLAERRASSRLVTSSNYPNILQSMLQGLDPAWRVINRGVPGEHTDAGARRFSGVLTVDRPGFVLIMEGTNDASADDDPAFIVANLQSMVLQARGNKTIPVLATIPPNFRNDPTAQDIIDHANVMIRVLARSQQVVLAEIFDGMNDRSLFGLSPDTDPLHPNERGYSVMAGIWFAAMQRAIPASAPPPPPADGAGTGTAALPLKTKKK